MRAYLRALHDVAGYFQRPTERLTPDQIRQYSAHLISDRKPSGNTVNQMVGALRFFYLTVLNKPWRGHDFPAMEEVGASMRLGCLLLASCAIAVASEIRSVHLAQIAWGRAISAQPPGQPRVHGERPPMLVLERMGKELGEVATSRMACCFL